LTRQIQRGPPPPSLGRRFGRTVQTILGLRRLLGRRAPRDERRQRRSNHVLRHVSPPAENLHEITLIDTRVTLMNTPPHTAARETILCPARPDRILGGHHEVFTPLFFACERLRDSCRPHRQCVCGSEDACRRFRRGPCVDQGRRAQG